MTDVPAQVSRPMSHQHHCPGPRRPEVRGHPGHSDRGQQEEQLHEGPEEGRVRPRHPEQRRQVEEPGAVGEQQPEHQPGEGGLQGARVQDDEGRDGQVDQEAGERLGELCVELKFLFKELLDFFVLRPSETQYLTIQKKSLIACIKAITGKIFRWRIRSGILI